MKRALLAGSFVAATFVATSAGANGRFPFANHLVVDPSDSKRLVLRTTYGIVQTFDGGVSWKWLCEASVGYGGTFDPPIGVTSTGRLLVGLFDGLATSTDRGCTFARGGVDLLDKEFVIDLVVEQKSPSRAVVVTSSGRGDAGFHVILAETTDGGETWTRAGVDLPADFNSETIEVAPSRSDRIYASGITGVDRRGVIEKSDDRGKTWERIPIELGANGLAPYLAAVDPNDPDVVYVRIDGDASASAPDRLLVSRDGAKTWTEIGSTKGDMLGFALSPDGSKVAFGGPNDGVFVASTADPKPEARAKIGVRCLTWAAAGLYACASEYPDGFTIGLSSDDGQTFAPIHKLAELSPLECAATTTTGRDCPKEWPIVQSTIGAAPIEDSGGLKPVDAGAKPTPTPPTTDGGWGCVVGRGAVAPIGLFAFVLALLTRWSRSRTR